MCWLGYNWASPRDRELLSRLRALPPLRDLVGEPRENKRWIKGQGFKPQREDDENLKEPFWEPGQPYLDARRPFQFLLVPSDATAVDPSFQKLHRAPDERLFKSPLVIFNKGFTKVAYSPFDVIFQDALQAISGPDSDRDLLLFLTATLLSPLARYLMFHLSSKGFYRYPLLTEVLQIPFPLPQDAPGKDAERSVHFVAETLNGVGRDPRFVGADRQRLIKGAKAELASYVHSYFDVNAEEEILIEDTVKTLQPSLMPRRSSSVPTLAKPDAGSRERYAGVLIDALHSWAGNASVNLGARCVVSENTSVAVLTIAKTPRPASYSETKASADLDQILLRLESLLPERHGSLVYLRNLAVLDTDRMHIVKPLTMRFWLRSAALNDADAAAAHLLSRQPRTLKA